MVSPESKIAAEFELLERTLAAIEETLARPRLELAEWMAIAGFLHNIYNGIENILKVVLKRRKVRPPESSPHSHRDLLDLAVSEGLITTELRYRLDEYRAFRHFFVHAYGLFLDPLQIGPLARGVGDLCSRFRSEIQGQHGLDDRAS